MPPQGMPHPDGSRVRRRSRPGSSGSLDRAWQGKSTPGPLRRAPAEPHRVRQRDSRSAGARRRRHRAAAERRRRLRLRQHRRVAADVAAAARAVSHGRAAHQHAGRRRPERARRARPSIRSAASSARARTSTACRSARAAARVVRHVFPADGEYKLFGRLVRGVEEGYAGVEGNETPHTFVITIDGEEVYSARDRRPEGSRGAGQGHERGAGAHRRAHDRHGHRDRRPARRRLHVARAAGAAAGRVAARAARQPGSPHDRRPAAAARPSASKGPYNVKGVSAIAEPRARVRVPPGVGGRRTGVRRADLHEPGAARLPASGDGGRRRGADGVLQAGARRAAATSTPASAPASRASWPARRSSTASSATRPACAPAPRTRSATSSWRRGCRSSCGAASRTSTLLNLAVAGRLRAARRARGAGAADDRRRARRRAGQQLHRPVAAAAQPRSRRSRPTC